MKSSIVLISNPVAKKASERKIVRASHFLRSRGYNVEVLLTEQKGDAERLAREAVKASPPLIIAAGGDGTFNEVINGIAGTEIPMAILPLGTTNVLAKELNVPEVVEGAMEVALRGTPKNVSLGKISRDAMSRYFCLMAGIGFDGEAVFRINETLKKISGKGAYIFSGAKTLSVFSPSELIFDIDGKTHSGYSAVISKVARYGGNFKITPHARLTDPVLYVCLFKGKKRLDIIRYISGIVIGRHLRFRDIEYVKATTVEVKGDAHIQIDGDYFGKTPARVEVVPDIVRLIF
jgi:YegS/Rv2252/BmrU family lipid kinase